MNDKETGFEKDLAFYFPEIYKLHQLGKAEKNVWEVVEVLLAMRAEDCTGNIRVNYSKGHIDGINKQVDVLAYKGLK